MAARNQAGQATLEFALTIVLTFGFILLFVQLAFVFSWGNYVHYATFMSARAYLSGSDQKADQEQRAEAYAMRMLKQQNVPDRDRYPQVSKGVADDQPRPSGSVTGLAFDHQNLDPTSRTKSWMQGVRYSFRSRLSMLPALNAKGRTKSTAGSDASSQPGLYEFDWTAESWLGREPTDDECKQALRTLQSGGGKIIYDNGC